MLRRIALVLCGLAGFAVTVWIAPHPPLARGLPPKPIEFPHFDRPGFEYFPFQSEMSKRVLYHDIGPSIAHAQRADILFLGNSRQQLGLREEFIVPRAQSMGLKVFSLACSGEPFPFELELIQKHDLRPKVVVVSGGTEFFEDTLSPSAQRTLAMTRWEAWRSFFEFWGSWELTSRLHSVLTRRDLTGREPRHLLIVYRSSRTGFWVTRQEPDFDVPVSRSAELPSYVHLLPAAKEIQEHVLERGGLMVLTMVPFAQYDPVHLPFLADALSVPLVLPDLEGLTTSERHHLTRASAERFSNAFWDQFIANPKVRQRLGLSPEHLQ